MAHPEALLVSCVLRSGDVNTALDGGITHKLFHVHRREWRWIENYQSQFKKPPSKAAFKAKFPSFDVYAVQESDMDHLVAEVKDSHSKVVLSGLLKTGITSMREGDVQGAVKSLHVGVMDLQSQLQGRGIDSNVLTDPAGPYAEVKERFIRTQKYGRSGIPTGFTTLDDRTGGPTPGEFWIVAARLGHGKTWTLVKMAVEAALCGYTVLYDTLEQTRNQITFRAHTMFSRHINNGKPQFTANDLMRGKVPLPLYKKFLQDLPGNVTGKLHVSDTSRGRLGPMNVGAQIEKNRPHIVFIDYLTLMERDGDDWRGVAQLSASIKQLASQYHVPIIAAAQINRSGAMGRSEVPGAEHLALSDAIGQDADGVITARQLTDHVIKMRMAKYRHGSDGWEWWNKFNPNQGEYREIGGDDALNLMDADKEKD